MASSKEVSCDTDWQLEINVAAAETGKANIWIGTECDGIEIPTVNLGFSTKAS